MPVTDLIGWYTPEMYQKAIEIVREDRRASTSYLTQKMQIGFGLAAALIKRMEQEGIVSPANHFGKREVL